jgi:hypothetical protein
MKILQEQPIDCRRDYVLQCSTCENEVSRVVETQAQILVSDAELQAASSLARMSQKKVKKAVKKIVAVEVR